MHRVVGMMVATCQRVIRGLLSVLLPSRTKRLILLASLAFQLTEKGSISSLTVEKLNSLMKLCSNQNALPFTGEVGKLIWQRDLIRDVFTTLHQMPTHSPIYLKPLAEQILTMIPSWLRYDKEETIKAELVTMLQYEKAQLA